MRVLTIRQPFASAIVAGLKDLENRSWEPPDWLMSRRILVHAGSRWHGLWPQFAHLCDAPKNLPRGALIGSVRVAAVGKFEQNPWWVGPLGWVLEDAVPLDEPIPCGGRLGLWVAGEDLVHRVTADRRHAQLRDWARP